MSVFKTAEGIAAELFEVKRSGLPKECLTMQNALALTFGMCSETILRASAVYAHQRHGYPIAAPLSEIEEKLWAAIDETIPQGHPG